MFTILLLSLASPPQFTVENKIPAFTVVNRVRETPTAYESLLARVLAGETVVVDSLPGYPSGPYRCFLEAGKPMFRKIAAPAVAAPTFPQGGFHSGHNCPLCGRQQLVISGYAGTGQHYHTCPYDGTVWRH